LKLVTPDVILTSKSGQRNKVVLDGDPRGDSPVPGVDQP
jgi:hypothetical protein